MTNEPVLVPRPRDAVFGNGTCRADRHDYTVDDTLPAQGYRLTITEEGVVFVVSADASGRFYADQTLLQLARQFGGELPVGEITDWPDLPVRGVMLDVSRDKVPTIGTLFALINRLAEWKINHVQLYSEHTFAYTDHEEVWAHASPFTADDIHAIQAHCMGRHVELVPNQNCFGHMERWLQHDRYRPLALRPEGFEFVGTHRGPSTLDPDNPEALTFVRSLLAELLPNFRSRRVNVGLDEPWELDDDRIDDYLEWVQRLRACPELDGYEMLMWGDIVKGRPELVDALPKDVTVCEWGYEADHPFDERSAVFAAAGRPFWTCPGTSSWISLLGRWTNAHDNLLAATEAAATHGGVGLLNTDWGDLGHLQYLPISLPPLAYGAAVSWCLETNRDLDVAAALDLHVFEDESSIMGALLLELGDAHRGLATQMWNMSLLVMPLYMPKLVLGRGPAKGLTADQFDAVRTSLVSGADRLGSASLACVDGELIVAELANTIDLVVLVCDDAVSRLRDGDGSLESIPEPVRAELAARLDPIIERHRALWLARNRPGGLDDSCRRLLRLQHCYQTGSTEGVPLYG